MSRKPRHSRAILQLALSLVAITLLCVGCKSEGDSRVKFLDYTELAAFLDEYRASQFGKGIPETNVNQTDIAREINGLTIGDMAARLKEQGFRCEGEYSPPAKSSVRGDSQSALEKIYWYERGPIFNDEVLLVWCKAGKVADALIVPWATSGEPHLLEPSPRYSPLHNPQDRSSNR